MVSSSPGGPRSPLLLHLYIWVFNVRAAGARRSGVFTNLSFPAQSCTSLPVECLDLGLLHPTAQQLCSFVAARLAGRTCSSFLQPLCLQRSLARRLHPTFCQARQLRLVSRIVPILARLVSRFVSSLVTSILPCCPVSSPASSPSTQELLNSLLSSPALLLGALLCHRLRRGCFPASTAAPFYCFHRRRMQRASAHNL